MEAVYLGFVIGNLVLTTALRSQVSAFRFQRFSTFPPVPSSCGPVVLWPVVAEEFGDWEDSRRRIDLLAVDKNANLVVIELKRTTDGGHMELQSVRYASMVSTMTFGRAVQIHAEFLGRLGEKPEEAQQRLLEFLGLEEPDEAAFAADVRIILVSEDFGKELTTAVLWLRDHDIDICCVRLHPYQNGTTKMRGRQCARLKGQESGRTQSGALLTSWVGRSRCVGPWVL